MTFLGDAYSVIFVFMVGIVTLYYLMKRSRRAGTLPPGPRRWPILGNLPDLSGSKMFYEKLTEIRKDHGDLIFIKLGSEKMAVVFGHKMVHEVLTTRSDSFQSRPRWLVEVKSLNLSKGILWSNGDYHANLVKFVHPALHGNGVGGKTMAERIQEEAEVFAGEVRNLEGKSSRLNATLDKAVANITCAVVFGSRFEYDDPEFISFMDKMAALLQRQGIKNFRNFFPVLQRLPENKQTKESRVNLCAVQDYVKQKIDAAKKSFDPNNIKGLIDMYIERCQKESENKDFDDESISHIARDIFVAGTENTSIGMLWLILYMICHPEVQDRCRQEIHQAIGKEKTVGPGDKEKLPYVSATINEVLRMANIAPLSVPHAVVEDTEFHGYTIPKNTMVITHLVSAHFDKEYWEDPEEFKPERFLDADGKLRTQEAFYPFSVGPRYCPGSQLANGILFTFFTTCIQRFTLKVPEGQSLPSLDGIQPGAFVEPQAFDVCAYAIDSVSQKALDEADHVQNGSLALNAEKDTVAEVHSETEQKERKDTQGQENQVEAETVQNSAESTVCVETRESIEDTDTRTSSHDQEMAQVNNCTTGEESCTPSEQSATKTDAPDQNIETEHKQAENDVLPVKTAKGEDDIAL